MKPPRRRAPPEPTSPREERPEGGRLVFGLNPVLEALRAEPERIDALYVVDVGLSGRAASELFERAGQTGLRIRRVPREKLAFLADGGVHQGVVAHLRSFDYVDLSELLGAALASGRPPLLVALDGIQDPHNLGAIARSAHAFGAHGLILPKDRSAHVTGTVAKASAGAIEHLPIAQVVNLSRALEELKQSGLWVAAADPEGETTPWQARLDGPLALVVGGEGPGVRKGVLSHCDLRVRIPMLGKVQSLNASVSAGVLLYEISRQRAGVPGAGTGRA